MRFPVVMHYCVRVWAIVIAIILLLTFHPATSEAALQADKVLVFKSRRQLWLLRSGDVLKKYRIYLGRQPVGAKTRRGDGRTPEGKYIIDRRNPNSQFFRALHISYPSQTDRSRAQSMGVSPGGNIMIHGLPNGRNNSWLKRLTDWTAGCIAVTNQEIREIWHAVPDGTPIEIRP